MAKSANQKCKLLYIVKILSEQTDENHTISTQELIRQLAEYQIGAERKSIYNDIEQLRQFGYDIVQSKDRQGVGYYLAAREFELPELKVLVDAVQASKFITLKKSQELIKKIEGLASRNEAKQLHRQVYVLNRIKTENESIYYNVDDIHKAIQQNKKISFRYYEYTVQKKMKFRREGLPYEISPWMLTWNDENYYLIAYDHEVEMIKHFRVDKMKDISITSCDREGSEALKQLDVASYANKTFGMFGGEEEMVTLYFANRLVGVVIDRFGKDIDIRQRDDEHFSIRVKLVVSGQFFGWLTGLGQEASIMAPESIKERYQMFLQEILESYKQSDETKEKKAK